MIRPLLALLCALSLGGCLPTVLVPPGGEMITYETEPGFCMGQCPFFRFSVNSDGKGVLRVFDGHGDLTAMRPFRASPEQVGTFLQRLAPYRPVGDLILSDPPVCKVFATDLAAVHLQWSGGGPAGRLVFNLGCDPDARRAMREAILGAPAALGLKKLPDPAGASIASTVM